MCGGRNQDPEGQYLYEFDDRYTRHAFITKVLSIVAAQLLLTAVLVTPFIFYEPLNEFARNPKYFWIPIVLAVALIVLMFVIACFEFARHSFPLNICLLILFTIIEAALLGFSCAAAYPMHVLIALGITLGIVIILIIFALQTKCDFTACIILPLILLIILIIMGIVAILWRNKIFMICMCSLGAVVFSFMLVIDVQLLMGGRHAYHISPEDYVVAALCIYVDIINIFRCILGLTSLIGD